MVRTTIATVCLFLTSLAARLPAASAAEPHDDRCVILISVDGLAGFYLDDPKAELPTIRRLARDGARAAGMVASFPTVTWPNHTTLVTGVPPARHGVLGNNYLDRASAAPVALIPDPLFDKDQIVKAPTIYDAAHRAGLTTAAIVWPATRSARSLDWTVPDMAGDEAWPKYATPAWLAELREAGLPVDRHGAWTKETSGGVQRDWLYSRMAAHVLKNHSPNLLLIHLVEVDHVQHRHGPRSPEAYWAVSFADDRVRDIVEAAGQSPHRDKTTIIVASDHGFFPIEKDIRPNVLLKQEGLLSDDTKRALCVSQGGAAMVYVLDAKERQEVADRLRKKFAAVEGIDAVLGPDEFAKVGQATFAADSRAPDLWLSAKSGYSFSDARTGDETVVPREARAGTHGYLPDQPDMLATLVLSGYGIKPGSKLEKVRNLDVAPTIARLLGVDLPKVEGRVLEEALQKTGR
ncbi:MAG: alkaline phosphatase family protein [Deltaproteobacteria bacterium]